MLGFIQNLGAMEIFLILLIVLLLFGAKRLPELSRSMGKSLREFKNATSEVEEDFRSAMNEEPKKQKEKEKSGPAALNSSSSSEKNLDAGETESVASAYPESEGNSAGKTNG